MSLPSKLPHPTRMVYEVLRRRPEGRASTQELFDEIHRLWPTRRRPDGEKQPQVMINGIPVYTRQGSTNKYPDHPVKSLYSFKNKLLPYLAKQGLVQKFAYKSEEKSTTNTNHLKFAWRFPKSYPLPPHLPPDTPAPAPFPLSVESTPFQPIDVDGLIAMPEKWDSARLIVTRTDEEQLAYKVGLWQKMEDTFIKYPKLKHHWTPSKKEPLSYKDQLVLDLKTEVGLRLNKRRQRARVKSTIQFNSWKAQMEERWAAKAPKLIEAARKKQEAKEAREKGPENNGAPIHRVVGGVANKYYFREPILDIK